MLLTLASIDDPHGDYSIESASSERECEHFYSLVSLRQFQLQIVTETRGPLQKRECHLLTLFHLQSLATWAHWTLCSSACSLQCTTNLLLLPLTCDIALRLFSLSSCLCSQSAHCEKATRTVCDQGDSNEKERFSGSGSSVVSCLPAAGAVSFECITNSMSNREEASCSKETVPGSFLQAKSFSRNWNRPFFLFFNF